MGPGRKLWTSFGDEMATQTVQVEPRGSQKAVNVAQPGKALPVVCVVSYPGLQEHFQSKMTKLVSDKSNGDGTTFRTWYDFKTVDAEQNSKSNSEKCKTVDITKGPRQRS